MTKTMVNVILNHFYFDIIFISQATLRSGYDCLNFFFYFCLVLDLRSELA